MGPQQLHDQQQHSRKHSDIGAGDDGAAPDNVAMIFLLAVNGGLNQERLATPQEAKCEEACTHS